MRDYLYKNGSLHTLVLLFFVSILSISGCNNNTTSEDPPAPEATPVPEEQNVVTAFPVFILDPNSSTPLAGLLELSTSVFRESLLLSAMAARKLVKISKN